VSEKLKEDQTFIGNSFGKEPFQFTIGQFQLIDRLEEAMLGMCPGESKTIYITSDNAFGQYNKQLVEVVSKNKLIATISLEVGKQFKIPHRDGITFITVTDIDESTVTLDANHPLAGKDLTFDIKLIEIK